MIVDLIKRQFGIKLSSTSVGRLLDQFGFTCQKPLYRAYQLASDTLTFWNDKVFPHIQKRAIREGVVIFLI